MVSHFQQAKASFEIHNSPLTENATIGFEFGYNIQEPDRLVIWEGQYGDFINGAQTIIDEFLTSARVKWGQQPSLVLLLPHAHEGQGPDHASARPERFLHRKPGTYTWLPFGGGIRRCLGAALAQGEMRIVLETIARRTDLRPADPAPERVLHRNVTMVPAHGAPQPTTGANAPRWYPTARSMM